MDEPSLSEASNKVREDFTLLREAVRAQRQCSGFRPTLAAPEGPDLRGRRRARKRAGVPLGDPARAVGCVSLEPCASAGKPLPEQLLPLLRALAALRLSLAEELGQL